LDLTALVCLAATTPAAAQTADFLASDATMGRVVRGQPFSADGLTTITQVLADGTRIEQSASSKFYRDSEGRVRREQTLLGMSALASSREPQGMITIADPVARVTWALDPGQKVARRSPQSQRELRGSVSFGSQPGRTISFTTGSEPSAEGLLKSLGIREIQGVAASGTATILTIPIQSIGNDRPIEITSERWISDDLQVLLLSRDHDPRTGTVEFRLTNIQRAEPPRDLFVVPQDYRIIDAPPPPPPPPPVRPVDPAGPPPPPPAPPPGVATPVAPKPPPPPPAGQLRPGESRPAPVPPVKPSAAPKPPPPPTAPPVKPIDPAGPPPPPPAPPQ
jgi:hypothetical protein